MSQTSAMSKYASFRIFSMVFGIIYTAFFYYAWSPFRYYPIPNQFSLVSLGPDAGPAILWYGWVLAAVVVSAVIALIFPRRLADQLGHRYDWIVPTLWLAIILFYEKRWFQ